MQSPGGTREDVAKTLGIKPEDVTVNVTLLGGGFGRKSKCDYALEAALLSKAIGMPVKVQWTRDDDIHHDFFHAVVGRADRGGPGREQQGGRLAPPQRGAVDRSTFLAPTRRARGGLRSLHGAGRHAVRIANIRCENGEAEAHTRIGWFRSVSNIPHGFAVQ